MREEVGEGSLMEDEGLLWVVRGGVEEEEESLLEVESLLLLPLPPPSES